MAPLVALDMSPVPVRAILSEPLSATMTQESGFAPLSHCIVIFCDFFMAEFFPGSLESLAPGMRLSSATNSGTMR